MNDMQEKPPIVYLKPGEVHVSSRPEIVVTVLGSCLSITMFNRRLKVGGICHVLLPRYSGLDACDGDSKEGFKYVDCSIRQMMALFDRRNVPRNDTEVKCFGGADMFTKKNPGVISIGRQNIEMAEKILLSEGLTLKAKDVGGTGGRKILFYTGTGEVLLKRLSVVNDPDVLWQEIMKND